MKQFKIPLFLLAALVITAATFAFRDAPNPSAATRESLTEFYWAYNGMGSETDPSSYDKISTDPQDLPEDCGSGSALCSIKAPESVGDPDEPELSGTLQNRIANRVTNQGDVFVKE